MFDFNKVGNVPEEISGAVKDLFSEMYLFEYGAFINGKKIVPPEYREINFEKDYKTLSIDTMRRERIGNCWDYVNYQQYKLDAVDIHTDCGMLLATINGGECLTHTFSIVYDNDKMYWFEHCLFRCRGVHEIKSLNELMDWFMDIYGIDQGAAMYLYRVDDSMFGISPGDYFKKATAGGPVLTR